MESRTLEAVTPEGNVGVIIGRFQAPDMHEGHRGVFDTVIKNHKKVVAFICSKPDVLSTRKNPMDYFTRMKMIQADYPEVALLPLRDMQSDHDWSAVVDGKIAEMFGGHESVVLYGSRDAFIPFYHGRYPTVKLAASVNVSATEAREAASNEVRAESGFRRGTIYAAHSRHPAVFPTVDIAVIQEDHVLYSPTGCPSLKTKQIALGRKNTDPKGLWRFPGGFVDPRHDNTFEEAARRELNEEFGISLNTDDLQYVGSHKIDDWRYRDEVDQIVTTLFITQHLWGPLVPGDDLDEARWFSLHDFDTNILVEEHKPLMQLVTTHLEKGN